MNLTQTSLAARPMATRTVDHGAIARNVRRMLRASGTELMVVVKADAFGHGSLDVARTALDAGATWLGVATVDEALALRAGGVTAPILAWLVDPWCDLEAAIYAGVTLSCPTIESLIAISRAARTIGIPARVHLELDTGMARGGSEPALWRALCVAAAHAERAATLTVTGVWSHLACAALPGEASIRSAVQAFRHAATEARAAGLAPSQLHLANSAAALAHPSTRMTMVRSGAAIYGIETVAGQRFGLEPALRVASRVTQLRRVPRGTGVGYLHEYRTSRPTTLALVPVGYADGVPRILSHGGTLSIGGRRCPIRGAISMDQLVLEVDATVALGDEVVLIGDPERGEPSALEWATAAGTVPHDILSGFGARVHRSAA
jgi:alanine racemase